MRRRCRTASRSSTARWCGRFARRARSGARSARRWCTSSAISSASTTTTSRARGTELDGRTARRTRVGVETSMSPGAAEARVVDAPGEETELVIEGVAVRLWRAVGLERFVDADSLLRADDPPEPPYWMHLWPGALAAARRVAGAAAVRPGVRVVELGC